MGCRMGASARPGPNWNFGRGTIGERLMAVVSVPSGGGDLTRRSLMWGGLALTLGGCNSNTIEMPGTGAGAGAAADGGRADGRRRRSARDLCVSA